MAIYPVALIDLKIVNIALVNMAHQLTLKLKKE